MKEFITQRELVDEFMQFLKHNDLLDNYRELLYERIYDSYTNDTNFLLFSGSDTIEEYIHKVNDGNPILDIDIAFMTSDIKTEHCPSSRNINDIFYIGNDFKHHFMWKYKKEIAAMLENGKKLLIRFLKSKKMKFTIEKFVRDTNALGAIMNTKKTMYNNIPTTIFAPMLNRVSNQGEFDIVMDVKSDFINYYIEYMKRQEE